VKGNEGDKEKGAALGVGSGGLRQMIALRIGRKKN